MDIPTWEDIEQKIENGDYEKNIPSFNIEKDKSKNTILYLKKIFPTPLSTIHFYKTNGNSIYDMQQSLCEWHMLAIYLQKIEHLDGYQRFIKQVKSDDGFLRQLYATVYIQQHMHVKSIEQIIHGQDIDIVAEINGEEIYFHVKTVDQVAKRIAQSDVDQQIFQRLWKYPIINADGKRLGLKYFNGAPSDKLTDEELNLIFNQLPKNLHQKRIITRPNKKHVNIDTEIELLFDWGVGSGKSIGINLARNLDYHIDHVEKYILNDKHKNYVIGCTVDAKSFQINNDVLQTKKIAGIFFLSHPVGFSYMHFERSQIFYSSTVNDINLEAYLPETSTISFLT